MTAIAREPRMLERLIGSHGDLRDPGRGLYIGTPAVHATYTKYPPWLLGHPTKPVHLATVEIPVAPTTPIELYATDPWNTLLSGLTTQKPYLTYLFRGKTNFLGRRDIALPTREGQLYFREKGINMLYILPDGTVAETDKGQLDIYVVLLPLPESADQYSSLKRRRQLPLNGNLPEDMRDLVGGLYVTDSNLNPARILFSTRLLLATS